MLPTPIPGRLGGRAGPEEPPWRDWVRTGSDHTPVAGIEGRKRFDIKGHGYRVLEDRK